MVVKWYAKASIHWAEMQDYCITQFGASVALKSAERVDHQLHILMKYPERGTPESLLNKKEIIYLQTSQTFCTFAKKTHDLHRPCAILITPCNSILRVSWRVR